jgi:hypothetical protein
LTGAPGGVKCYGGTLKLGPKWRLKVIRRRTSQRLPSSDGAGRDLQGIAEIADALLKM